MVFMTRIPYCHALESFNVDDLSYLSYNCDNVIRMYVISMVLIVLTLNTACVLMNQRIIFNCVYIGHNQMLINCSVMCPLLMGFSLL